MSSAMPFEKICDSIFALSSNIRSVRIINKMGDLVSGGMRGGIQSMEDKESSSKLYLEFVLRSEMRKDQDAEFGKTIYSFSEKRENKICSISIIRKSFTHGIYREKRTTP